MVDTTNPYNREYGQSLVYPAKRMYAITPSDTADLPRVIKAMRVFNGTGSVANVQVRTIGGDDIIIPFLPGMFREDIIITRVFVTSTTPGLILHGYTD